MPAPEELVISMINESHAPIKEGKDKLMLGKILNVGFVICIEEFVYSHEEQSEVSQYALIARALIEMISPTTNKLLLYEDALAL
jgi:hypothetical protein